MIDQGRIQDFKLGGGLKKIAPREGRRKNFVVFRVKNQDFSIRTVSYISKHLRGPGWLNELGSWIT
jgi:hypothetical protein